ncbi:MAG TPA: helix-turn-helix domain-containing protein, partial [Bradyrhizobium sp.]|nr:helix-turn-helix domain-containing protein [Bradyrhizobium sp.]
MKGYRRRSDRCVQATLRSPGRPPEAQRENCRRFWMAIASGRSSEDAGVDAGVSPTVGVRWFRRAGGMPPTHFSQSSKPLSGRYLSFAEREEIAILRAKDHGVRAIARLLDRPASTISRELRRNAARRHGAPEYRATTAQWHADRSARRPKPAKLAVNPVLQNYVQDRLAGMIARPDGVPIVGPKVLWKGRRAVHRQHRRWATAWSPEQISRRLRLDFPEDETMRISHEAIYQALYVQGRGALRRELSACLRTGRALRMPRARTRKQGRSFVSPEIMISQRPAEATDRAVPGHWEGDLIVGPKVLWKGRRAVHRQHR